MIDSWIKELETLDLSQNKYSQFGEELYIKHILGNIGFGNKFLVDLGASEGLWLSNTRLFTTEFGFNGILMDFDAKGSPLVHHHVITKENVVDLLRGYGCPQEFTFLSIDLDGNDYDIIKEVCSVYSPRLIVCEYNGMFEEHECVKIKYNPDHVNKSNDYFGFSFGACLKLAENLGYKVIFQNKLQNAYLVRKDLLEFPDAKIDLKFTKKESTYSKEGEWESV